MAEFAAGARVQVVRRAINGGTDYKGLFGRATGRRDAGLVEVEFPRALALAPEAFHPSELALAPLRLHLYLDIDGVVSPLDEEGEGLVDHWGGYARYTAAYGEMVAPALVGRLNALIARHGVVGHWATTWMHEAPGFGRLIGLVGSEGWPVLAAKSGVGWGWPKFTAVRAHVEEASPDLAIWFDDHLSVEPEARQWAEEHPRVLAFAPRKNHGIVPAMMDEIDEALDALDLPAAPSNSAA